MCSQSTITQALGQRTELRMKRTLLYHQESGLSAASCESLLALIQCRHGCTQRLRDKKNPWLLLCDEMGLGKTTTTLACALELRAWPVLVLVPNADVAAA